MGHPAKYRGRELKGKIQESPLTEMMVYGTHPFPSDIEESLRKIDEFGRRAGRFALGENWPFSPDEFEWARGENLDEAREVLAHMITMFEAGRGDEVLSDPRTKKPFLIQRGEGRR